MAVVLTDQTGNGHTLTNHNSPAEYTATHPFVGSTEAQGYVRASNQYSDTPNATDLQLTGSITLMIWVNLTSSATSQSIISKANIALTNINYNLYYSGSDGKLHFVYTHGGAGAQDTWSTNASAIGTGAWHQITFTYTYGTGSTALMMIDGSSVAGAWSGTGNNAVDTPTTDTLQLSGYQDGTSAMLDATGLTDIRIYNALRSSAAITADYNTLLTKPTPVSLVAWWPFQTVVSPTTSGFFLMM